MAPKSKRSWFDVQMTVLTVSIASILGLWNLFAGPDREAAQRKAVELAAIQPEPVELPPTFEPSVPPLLEAGAPSLPEPGEKILLGGTAPQTKVVIQTKRNTGGGGSAGGSGSNPVTSTGSS